ncbi:MAG: WD40 repeat domain-containing protein [Arcobacter butzleri]|nr:WD40 repeat domain-containing protein [Aliarcobacter butzleri]
MFNSIFQIKNILSIPNEIVLFRYIDEDSAMAIDSSMKLYNIELRNFTITNTIELQIDKNSVLKIMSDSNDELLISTKNGNVAVYNLNNHKSINLKRVVKDEIIDIRFSKDHSYFVIKNKDDKLFIFLAQSKNYIFSISNYTNSKLVKHFFSLDSKLFVMAYENGQIFVFDTFDHSQVAEFRVDGVVSDGFVYDDNYKIFLTLKNGIYSFCSFDIVKNSIITPKYTIEDIATCYTDSTHSTVMLGTKKGLVYLVELSSLDMLYNFFFESAISRVFINEKLIIIVLENNQIYFFDKNYNLKAVLETLYSKEYKKSFDYINENIFLYMNQTVLLLTNKLWEKLLQKIVYFIGEDNQYLADRIAQPILTIQSKKETYEAILSQKNIAIEFNKSIKSRDLKTAYSLAYKHPFLKDTNHWKKSYEIGRKLYSKLFKLEVDSKLFKDIYGYLKYFPDFKNRSEQLKIKLDIISILNKAIESNDKKFIFHLANSKQYLKQTSQYLEVVKASENEFHLFVNMVHSRVFEEAYKIISTYFQIDSLYEKIYDYMKLYYMIEIKTLPSNQVNLALELYKNHFGEDDNFLHLLKFFNKTNIDVVISNKKIHKFYKSILEFNRVYV